MNSENARRGAAQATRKLSNSPQARGNARQIVGGIRQRTGDIIGDRDLETRGAAQGTEGKVDHARGEIKEKLEYAKARIKGGVEAVKEKVREARH